LVDGGVRNITPLSSAFDAEPEEIYVLLTSRLMRSGNALPASGVHEHTDQQWDDNWLGTRVSGLDVLKRTVDILTDEVDLDDIRGALAWNEVLQGIAAVVTAAAAASPLSAPLAEAIARLDTATRKRRVPIHVLAPQQWYGLDNSSTEFSPILIRAAVEHGKQIGADPTRWLLS
jgi:hypothetical protein